MAEVEKLRLANLSWDGDKEEDQFFIFLGSFGSLVNAIKHGPLLEEMLDSKLRRKKASRAVPSFILDDPDFIPPSTAATSATSSGETDSVSGEAPASPPSAAHTGGSGGSGNFSLGQHHTAYTDFPEEAKALDGMLYNIFKMCVKGSKQAIIECVTFPSYVQAVCVLVKHMSISRMRRITAAFTKIDSLSYQGDTLKFQSDFLTSKREIDNCDATINDYLMCRLMRAFDGKSKTIQFQIAKDFNEMESSQINFYDLVQGYCASLASVGDGKPHRVGAVQCTECNSEHHTIDDCPKKRHENSI